MRGIARLVAVLLLALGTSAALPAAAAPLGPDLSSTGQIDATTVTPTPTPTDDGLLSDTNGTVENTTDTGGDTTNDTLETTDQTTDAVDSTVNDTIGATTDALDASTELLDETTASLTDADTGIFAALDGNATADGPVLLGDEPAGSDAARSTDGGSDEAAPPIAASIGPTTRQIPTDPGPLAVGATAITGVGAVAVGTMLGTGTGVEREVARRTTSGLERLVRTVAPFRYSRYDGSDPLEHEDRATIHDYVRDHPGTYVSAVSEAVSVPHSTARHHVRILEREGLVENAKVRGRRRLFPANARQQELAAAMSDEATAAILDAIARLGPCSGTALADEVDRSVGTVSHHLTRLEDDGLVVREKEGRTTVNRLSSEVAAALAPDQEIPEGDAPAVSAD